jgi:HEAT repeat protein
MMLHLLIGMLSAINILSMQNPTPTTPQKQALAELKSILTHRQKFIKAHAAEYLIWTGHPDIALKEFLKEEKLHGTEPKYRVVIWRILVQAEHDPARKKMWLNKMYDAYKDLNGPDRTHATEALAKLQQPVADLFPEVTSKTLVSDDRNLQTYAVWASSYGSEIRLKVNREELLHRVLTDTNAIIRRISAYVLRKEQGLSTQQWDKITAAALAAHKTDELYIALLTTALVTAPAKSDSKKLAQVDELLTKDVHSFTVGERTEIAQALAEKGTKTHLPLLINLMEDKDSAGIYDPASDEGADMRAAAAYAILKINSRH